VDILATWQPVTDRLSGYQKCHLTITGLFDIMIDFDLLPNTYIYPQPQKPSVWWRPAKNKEEKDSLNICNVKLTKLLLASDSPLIHFDYLDSLLNVNTRQVGTVDLPDPLPHEYQLTITDSLEKSFLRWQPIPPQLTQWFDHYVINFSDRIDYLGRPLTNFRFLRQPVWEIPIDSLKKDITYYFHVMAEFADGSCTNWSNVVEFTKSTSASHLIPIYADAQDGKPVQPENYQLYQNYPNPFNPVTTIEYDLPQTDWVILRIYDVFGRTIRTLIDEEQPFGRYRLIWDGRNENGIQTASGVYFITMNTSRFQTTKKCALMK